MVQIVRRAAVSGREQVEAAEVGQAEMKLTGTAKYLANAARQRRESGPYYGITRTVTRGSKRVLWDFKPPFGKRKKRL